MTKQITDSKSRYILLFLPVVLTLANVALELVKGSLGPERTLLLSGALGLATAFILLALIVMELFHLGALNGSHNDAPESDSYTRCFQTQGSLDLCGGEGKAGVKEFQRELSQLSVSESARLCSGGIGRMNLAYLDNFITPELLRDSLEKLEKINNERKALERMLLRKSSVSAANEAREALKPYFEEIDKMESYYPIGRVGLSKLFSESPLSEDCELLSCYGRFANLVEGVEV